MMSVTVCLAYMMLENCLSLCEKHSMRSNEAVQYDLMGALCLLCGMLAHVIGLSPCGEDW